jgi:hypothetical protein
MADDVKNAGERLKVFISYSRRDAPDFAEELVAGLDLAGFAPFIDRLDIKPGEPWEDRLGGLIAQSDTVVFVITPEAVTSERCTWEVERTLELSIWDADSGKEIAPLKGHGGPVVSAGFSPEGKRVVAASSDHTARIWDVTWATLVGKDTLRERVCAEKLVGAAQDFTDAELEDPILRGIDKDDPIARNPCLRRGPLSLDYWTRLPALFWRSLRFDVFANRS